MNTQFRVLAPWLWGAETRGGGERLRERERGEGPRKRALPAAVDTSRWPSANWIYGGTDLQISGNSPE